MQFLQNYSKKKPHGIIFPFLFNGNSSFHFNSSRKHVKKLKVVRFGVFFLLRNPYLQLQTDLSSHTLQAASFSHTCTLCLSNIKPLPPPCSAGVVLRDTAFLCDTTLSLCLHIRGWFLTHQYRVSHSEISLSHCTVVSDNRANTNSLRGETISYLLLLLFFLCLDRNKSL